MTAGRPTVLPRAARPAPLCDGRTSSAGPLVSRVLLWRAQGLQRSASGLEKPHRYPDRMRFDRITVNPARMRGLPCIRDTRVTVSAVLGQLAAGRTFEDVLGDYPYLERDDVFAALEYAAAAVEEREIPLPAAG